MAIARRRRRQAHSWSCIDNSIVGNRPIEQDHPANLVFQTHTCAIFRTSSAVHGAGGDWCDQMIVIASLGGQFDKQLTKATKCGLSSQRQRAEVNRIKHTL